MAKWLDKYEQGGLVLKKKTKDNFDLKANPNDVQASVGPDFVGLGYDTTGRNYSPAWGGQFAMGGSMPGAVGFTYARTAGSAPSNGKYAKKTKASAQDGKKLYGATDEEEESVKNFAKNYYASDRFKKNLYDKGNFGIKDRSAQVSKDAINKINNLSYTYKPLDRTGFDKGNIINMGNPNEYLNAPKDLAFAHEMFHPMETEILSSQPRNVMVMLNHNALKNRKGDANALYQDMVDPLPTYIGGVAHYLSAGDKIQNEIKDFATNEQSLSSTSMHDDLIGEVRADIMALRYLANKKGIWDVTKSGVKDMTPEMLNELYKSPELNKQMYKSSSSGKTTYLPSKKAKEPGSLKAVDPPKNPGLMLDRLRQRYSDADLLYLMNKLAYESNNQDQTIAQDGKKVNPNEKKYQAPDKKQIEDWFSNYYASPFFKENLYDKGNAYLPDEGEQEGQAAISKIKGLKYTYNDYNSYGYPEDTNYDLNDTVNLGDPNNYGNQPKSTALAHELGHVNQAEILSHQPRNLALMLNRNQNFSRKSAADTIYELANEMPSRYSDGKLMYPSLPSVGLYRKSNLKEWMDREAHNSGAYGHDSNVGEIRADVMALRYLAAKKGIWDASKEKPDSFTPEMLNKLYKEKDLNISQTKKDRFGVTTNPPSEKSKSKGNLKEVKPPKNPGMILERLRTRYKDSDLLYLMNKLAKNEGEAPTDKAQNGKEMKFYQEGLDFKPKSISKNGSVIKDDRGQWAYPGEVTEIGSNNITMQGVDYPVLGVSDTGDTKLMQPGENYKFKGKKVTEFPIAQDGKKLKNVKGESEKFLKGWMDSPMYNKMINTSINASPNQQEEILKAISREDQLKKMSWEFADLNADKSWLDKLSSPILGQFVQDKNKVLLNPNSSDAALSEVGVHEGSHATDLGGANIPSSDVEKMWKYRKEYAKQKGFFTKLLDDEDFNTYVGRPTETRARLNAIRYLGKKEGIYDPYKEKVDKDILKKLPSSIFHPTELDQLRLIYSDDQIIDLLNSVSKNDSNKLIPQAQDGGWLNKYK
jgi:hypothetical protein